MNACERCFLVWCLLAPILGFSIPEGCLAQSTRDSASVSIITYGPGTGPPERWVIGAPTIQLGGAGQSGPEEFFWIVGIAMLANGSLVVGDGGSSELRFFDATDGTHIRTVGGEGGGPGEIERLWDMWTYADTIVVEDARGTASYFDSQGQYQRRQFPPISGVGRRLRRAGFFQDGTLLTFGTESSSDLNDRSVVGMRILASKNDKPEFLLQYPHHVVTRKGRERAYRLVYGPVAALAPVGDSFCVGFPAEYAIDCFTKSGEQLHRVVRKEWERVAVTDEDRDDFFTYNEAANPGPRSAPFIRFLRQNAQFAEEFPSFGRLLPTQAGELWVGPMVPDGDTPILRPFPKEETTWSVYSLEGTWLSDVVLPPRFDLMYAGETCVAGVLRDQLDVESVVVLPLLRQ